MSLNRLRKRADERRQRRQARVASRLASMGSDPVALTGRIQELELMLQGAYAIVHNLVRDHPELQGLTIPYEKLKAIPPTEHLRTQRNKRGDVTLVFEVDADAEEPRDESRVDEEAADDSAAPQESEAPAAPSRARRRGAKAER